MCFERGIHIQFEKFCLKDGNFFFVGQKLIKSTNKYVFTATFERGKGSKSDVKETFSSE